MTIAPSPVGCPPVACTDCHLRATQRFAPVSEGELAYIEQFRSEILAMPAGATIIPEYKLSTRLFTLYSGWAFRYKSLSDGRRQILNFLAPGDLIGLQEEFADGVTPGVEALTEVNLCVFPRDNLWPLFREYPSLGYDITWLAAREEHWVDDHLVTAGRRNAEERVAMLLMHLYRRGERAGMVQEGSIDFPFTQQHIADALGLSLVHTNKTLRRLRTLGLHRLENGRLWLLDPKALERVADYYERPQRRLPLI